MTIDVGLRLRELVPPHRTWEVVRIIRPVSPHGQRHAGLRLAADHKTTRMLSLKALEDLETYQPLTDTSGH